MTQSTSSCSVSYRDKTAGGDVRWMQNLPESTGRGLLVRAGIAVQSIGARSKGSTLQPSDRCGDTSTPQPFGTVHRVVTKPLIVDALETEVERIGEDFTSYARRPFGRTGSVAMACRMTRHIAMAGHDWHAERGITRVWQVRFAPAAVTVTPTWFR